MTANTTDPNAALVPRPSVLSLAIKEKAALYAAYMPFLKHCLLYTSPSPRDRQKSRMPSSA